MFFKLFVDGLRFLDVHQWKGKIKANALDQAYATWRLQSHVLALPATRRQHELCGLQRSVIWPEIQLFHVLEDLCTKVVVACNILLSFCKVVEEHVEPQNLCQLRWSDLLPELWDSLF